MNPVFPATYTLRSFLLSRASCIFIKQLKIMKRQAESSIVISESLQSLISFNTSIPLLRVSAIAPRSSLLRRPIWKHDELSSQSNSVLLSGLSSFPNYGILLFELTRSSSRSARIQFSMARRWNWSVCSSSVLSFSSRASRPSGLSKSAHSCLKFDDS